ncbi:MAG TPA: hypothetical protein ENJ37_09635 [Deltaproteobacteria bacterium]|nr:hypothetical protein [Deltaproteobacteria bacterium]
MRAAFFKALKERAEDDGDLYLLTADLGFRLFDDFKEAFPERFLDIGVAEGNMIGTACGLALSGKNVFCYSIIPFITMRAYEQIRMDVAYHDIGVKLIGVGGGFTYGLEGFSHFGIEDLALMRAMPNMSVVVPADPAEAEVLARISSEFDRPLYIRMGKTGEPLIHDGPPDFRLGRGMVLAEGSDVALLAVGSMVKTALDVRKTLSGRSLSATVVNMHTLKPLDTGLVKECALSHAAVFTLEEHSVIGGLGSAVAEVLSEISYGGLFRRVGIPEKLCGHVGDGEHLKRRYGLGAAEVAELIINNMENAEP